MFLLVAQRSAVQVDLCVSLLPLREGRFCGLNMVVYLENLFTYTVRITTGTYVPSSPESNVTVGGKFLNVLK